MSSNNGRSRLVALLVLVATIVGGCVYTEGGEEPPRDAYLTPVAKAVAAGLTPHWLGTGFNTNGVTFDTLEARYPVGPAVRGIEGVETNYIGERGEDIVGRLNLNTARKSEWVADEEEFRARLPRNAGTRSITVAGREAELITVSSPTRPINGYHVIIDMGDTVVVATTSSGSTGGRDDVPDVNPLIDEETLLAALEQLRPYPD
jgi:hypothetical protein